LVARNNLKATDRELYGRAGCFVPFSPGIKLSDWVKVDLWDMFYMEAPRRRAEFEKKYTTLKKSIATLAARYGVNFKTILKWKHREGVVDHKSGPKKVRSSLSEMDQAVVCEFRRVTKLPLDDVFIALKDKIPALTRSNLHRCLQKNGFRAQNTACLRGAL
jgi:hypothetical protein